LTAGRFLRMVPQMETVESSRGEGGSTAPVRLFRYCPRCGGPRRAGEVTSPFHCSACGLVYYFNMATAGVALIEDAAGRWLFIRRALEPAQGKLAVPGGFVDQGERVEDALRREVKEEVNLELQDWSFLCSQLNTYPYREVAYPVLDLVFTATVESTEGIAALDGVAGWEWLALEQVKADEVAFPSLRAALGVLALRRGLRWPCTTG
jgi:ADP-ribose pyrophosphatase YjhB (NUDIX family)